MSQAGSLIRLAIGLVGVLVGTHSAEAGNSTDAEMLSVRAVGGIIVQYPRGWKAAVTKDGMIVAVAGPAHGRLRPVATFFVTRGEGDAGKMLDSAAKGLGKLASITLLGERQLSSNRWARYYVRGGGTSEEYVMIGIAKGKGWIATMVGVDTASDPLLRVHADVLQGLLAGIIFPAI